MLFIDTSFILDLVFENKKDRSYNNDIKHKIKSNYEVKIPQIVIGEIIVQIIEKTRSEIERNNKLAEFYKIIQYLTDLNNNSPPINGNVLKMAVELTRNEDSRNMDYHDAIITSFALTSECSCKLLTLDKDIMESEIVYEKTKEQKDKGRTIRIIDKIN